MIGLCHLFGGVSIISYQPLWDTMDKNGVTTYQLLQHGVSRKTIYNLKRNENITMLTAEKLCNIIGCDISDIVTFVPDCPVNANKPCR